MRKKILFMSTIFSLMLSFSALAKTIYTPNSNGGYDTYNTETGCTGWIPNTPITVGSDSSEGNSTVTSGGESTWTKEEDDVSTKTSTVSVTGSTIDNSSGTGTDTVNTSGGSSSTGSSSGTTGNVSGNNSNQGTVNGGNNNDYNNEGVIDNPSSNDYNNEGVNENTGGLNSTNEGSDTAESNKSPNNDSTTPEDKTVDYVDDDGNIIKEKFAGSIQKVELGNDGELIIYSYDKDGNVVTETSNFTSGSTRYTYYTDEDGSTRKFSQKVSQSDDYIVEEEFLYFTWDMINMTNNQSKFYGSQVQVAKTTSSSTKVQPDLDGTYKIIGTPWYRKDYYKEITIEEEGDCDEFGNCDTDTYTERVLVDSKVVAKSSDEYTAKVPLFCNGCPVPVICVNGACDCATTLNAICDEAKAADLIIKERVELEK